MAVTPISKRKAQQNLQKAILKTLHELAPKCADNTSPPSHEWPSTRQIADAHDISIYKARLLLLNMVKNGHAAVCAPKSGSVLRWYPLI
jgi:hypothetical protein